MSQQHGKRPARPTSPLRTVYLTVYNTVFAALWATLFVYTVLNVRHGKREVFRATEPWARWLQTLSLIEVAHAGFRIIPSPLSTTALQVLTRVIQVWMVWYCFPLSTSSSAAYPALVLAWSAADAVRFVYLAANLHGRAAPALGWVRYTQFYVLYPIGISAEWWLLYLAIEPAGKISWAIPPVFYFCLALYIPGAYTMYTYMIRQRRKTLGKRRTA
ncbi:PTPLA-domain-containing protein [Pyrenochaeta sp. DS3sAY3a]|nr:PTPLA-domain-containing protein [Pyrenochaeta sp. DS3sAY3a]